MSPEVEVWTPNHWTAKEFPDAAVLNRVAKLGISEKVTESGRVAKLGISEKVTESGLEGFEDTRSALLGRKSMSRGGTSKYKDPEEESRS